MSRFTFFLFVVFSLGLLSCGTSRQFASTSDKNLHQLWDSLNIANSFHTGISVYDLNRKKYLFTYRHDNYFTPASTTKIFTLFAAMQSLDQLVPAGYYIDRGDTLIVWGGGDPGTKYPDPKGAASFIDFLKARDETIIFSNDHFRTSRFGRGWAWDDYPYYYQTERNAYPIYGNQLWIQRSHDTISIVPKYFSLVVQPRKDTIQKLQRNELGTLYDYRYDFRRSTSTNFIPATLFENDLKGIWREATGKEIFFENRPYNDSALKINGTLRDTLLRKMMQDSDNFIAEQLLLAAAMQKMGRMDERAFIQDVLSTQLRDLPDSITWVDGSGLSRYNLFTPRSVVHVIEKIISLKGIDYIKTIFPAGGQSGTLRNVYASNNKVPYLYAKTGSMRNVYCISGVLMTKSGNTLAFSWMNNQLNTSSKELTPSIEIFLTYLRDRY